MRSRSGKWTLFVGIGLGLAAGLVLAWFLPNTPLHAVATDRIDTFAIATGHVDVDIEAVYFLDFLTGDLNAVVIGRGAGPTGCVVTGHYARNVIQDMKLDADKNLHFLMVTGAADLTRGGRPGQVQPSKSVVYVAEATSGRVAAYAIPWNASAHLNGQFVRMPLMPVLSFPMRGTGPSGAAKGKDSGKE
jgi:hypothetical protein